MEEVKHTPGPWSMWTSCSFRRISSEATGRDGDVLHAVVQHSDGHPDLHFPNGGFNGPDARLILAAPDLLLSLQESIADFAGLDETAISVGWGMSTLMRVRRARAAIAKATGDQN